MSVPQSIKETLRSVAACVTGAARRSIQAWAAKTFCNGSTRHAETVFGWNRKAVASGIRESEGPPAKSGTEQETRGRPSLERTHPELVTQADQLLGTQSQVDPKFQTETLYTRMTGESLRAALAESLNTPISRLPTTRTLRRLMNRRGFSLKQVRKTIPQKKIPQTDAIFGNVRAAQLRAEKDPSILRVSIDCKARVKIGPFSRGGSTRDAASQKAVDHDMAVTPTVTPCGILEVASGQLSIGMIVGTTTSDSIVDTLERWWQERKAIYPHVQTLMIDLDNGPDSHSHRTQFVHRITQFADSSGLRILLVYYPPYHSKYNPVERCWSALERHWNGALLSTIEMSLKWVATMTWKQLRPIVWTLDNNYERGKKLTKSQMKPVSQRLLRLTGLERWCVMILPVVQTT